MSSQQHGIDRIRRLADHAERRLRLDRALRVGAKGLCAALVLAIVDVAARKVGLLSEGWARAILGLAGAGVLVATGSAWAWRLPERAGARTLDRFHALHDRLANALAFHETKDRTPFMDAAIEDAMAVTPAVDLRLAIRIGWPRSVGMAAALAGALALTLLFEVRAHTVALHAKTIDAIEMAPDDLEDVKDFLKQIQQNDPSDDTKVAIDDFNRLVDDIASRRLDRTEAFRRLEALEHKLLDGAAADRKTLEQQLESMGEELKKSDLTRPAGNALVDAKLDKARDAMRDLSKKVRAASAANSRTPLDKAQLDQMREAIKKAAEQANKRSEEIEQRRQQLADEILKRKQQMGDGGTDEERSLLEKKQRELDRLDRESDEHKNAGRQLDRLDRELEQAAEDLMKDLGASADDLDQGAEDLNRMEEQQASQEEKEQLKQKLQEMRELLRQQGQGGKGQIVRLKRFGQMARGQGGQGQSGQGGQSGEGQGGQSQGSQGQEGQGQPGGEGQQGQQGQGQGSQGGGQNGQGSETWVLGPNGEKMLMLSRGRGEGGGDEGGGEGEGQGGGRRWGTGHDPKLQGQATNPKMGTQDTQVQGADSAQGASRSQVILGASERGFASKGYRKVYTEYHQVAEESVAKDEIPGGYRFYVKRYFQLIRPRDE